MFAEIETAVQNALQEDAQVTPSIEPFLNRITLGDCIERLRAIPAGTIDLIVTDPPYICRYRDRSGRIIENDNNDEWLFPAFFQAARTLKNHAFCLSFYGWNKAEKFLQVWKACGLRPVGHFTWVKPYCSSVGFAGMCHESAYLLAKGNPRKPAKPPVDVQPWEYTGNKLHPTQKPVSALVPIIDAYSKPGDVILDPFGGSGTTAEAAVKTGRKFVIFEKDENYFRLAAKRLAVLSTQ